MGDVLLLIIYDNPILIICNYQTLLNSPAWFGFPVGILYRMWKIILNTPAGVDELCEFFSYLLLCICVDKRCCGVMMRIAARGAASDERDRETFGLTL